MSSKPTVCSACGMHGRMTLKSSIHMNSYVKKKVLFRISELKLISYIQPMTVHFTVN